MMAAVNLTCRPSRGLRRPIAILNLLTWAFRTECARLEFDQIPEWGQSVVGGTYLVAQRGRLGCAIDGGGRSATHPDADVVAGAVAMLPVGCGGRGMAITVAHLARIGSVPDWMPGATPRIVPREWRQTKHGRFAKTERVGAHVVERRGRRVEVPALVCPVTVSPTPAKIAAARRDYLLWWSALLDLRVSLSSGPALSSWQLTADLPPVRPWAKSE